MVLAIVYPSASMHQHISPQQWATADAAYRPLLDQGSA